MPSPCKTCCIFWPAFWCCTPQTLVKIFIFSIFCVKKLKKFKKITNLVQNLVKNQFLSLHQNAGWVFYSQIWEKLLNLGINTWPAFWCKLKKPSFLHQICYFLHFFSFLSQKWWKWRFWLNYTTKTYKKAERRGHPNMNSDDGQKNI